MTGKPILTPEIHLLRRSYYNPAFFAEAQPEAQRESETTPCHTTPCPLGIEAPPSPARAAPWQGWASPV